MGVLTRVRRLVKANLNELIEKAEDPEKTIRQCIRDMEGSLAETREKVSQAIAGYKMLTGKREREEAEIQQWEKRGVLALQKGDENLAREAILKKRSTEGSALRLSGEENRQAENVRLLKTTLAALESKLAEAKEKKNILIARMQQAEAQKEVLRSMKGVVTASGKVDTSALEAFERAEEHIMGIEAEVEALNETPPSPGAKKPPSLKTTEETFKEMEDEDYIRSELDRLREKAKPGG